MLSKFLSRLGGSRLENSEDSLDSLRTKRDSRDGCETIPATTDPELFQKRVAELRLALANSQMEEN